MPKNVIQTMPNWQTPEYFATLLLFSDNIVVKARKRRTP